MVYIGIEVRKTESNIAEAAIPITCPTRDDRCAVCHQLHLRAERVAQRKERHGGAVWQTSENVLRHDRVRSACLPAESTRRMESASNTAPPQVPPLTSCSAAQIRESSGSAGSATRSGRWGRAARVRVPSSREGRAG